MCSVRKYTTYVEALIEALPRALFIGMFLATNLGEKDSERPLSTPQIIYSGCC